MQLLLALFILVLVFFIGGLVRDGIRGEGWMAGHIIVFAFLLIVSLHACSQGRG